MQYKAHIINCIFTLLHRSEFLVVKGDVNGVMGEQPSKMLYAYMFLRIIEESLHAIMH